MTDDQATCGKGLAANAVLPRRLAALMAAMAAMLENHVLALDPDETNGRLERDAYERLVGEQRAIASGLEALARAMEGYRDLPMAKHDMALLTGPASRDMFSSFIQAEEGVLTLLQDRVKEHRAMLGELRR
jgi:hypothetical protein